MLVKRILFAIILSSVFISFALSADILNVPEERVFAFNVEKELNEFTVAKEKDFILKVRGNPTTGYGWFLMENSDKQNLMALNVNEDGSCKNYEQDKTEQRLLGVGGNYYFKFNGLKEGKYNILLVQKRVWENSNFQEKVVTLNIVPN